MILVLTLVVVVVVAAGYLWRARGLRRAGVSRLDQAIGPRTDRGGPVGPRPFPPRYPWLAPIVATAIAAAIAPWFAPSLAIGTGALVGAIVYIVETALAESRLARLEQQLANTLDLVVATLRAGGALMPALEAALADTAEPLQPFLRDVVTRLKLGDAPASVLADLTARLPSVSVRLFALTLGVHWEVGGSLASTLGLVARTVRDRAELSRRIRTQGAEAHLSVGIVMVLSYALALLMWRSNPDRTLAFFLSPVGSELVGLVIMLQAAGLFWMSRLSRIEY